MKMVLLLTIGVVLNTVLPKIVEAASPSDQQVTTQAREVLSAEAAQAMIMGEWENMVGPNPFTTKITQDTLWNSRCWSRYKILDVRPGKIKKTDAYIVEIEFTSAGGPGQCGHSDKPSFSIALISADAAASGQATTIYWLDCNSEKDFQAASKYQDPRDSDAVCSRYTSSRKRTSRKALRASA